MIPGAFALRRQVLGLLAATTASAVALAQPPPPREDPRARLDTLCEYGIVLAQGGDAARAESVFVALLSEAPADPRALNNLGNIALLRGNPRVADQFYLRASASDTSDPGIALNRATALLLMGEDRSALDLAGSAVRRAGGLDPAAHLLGLFLDDTASEETRGGKKPLSREEALLLLERAAAKVPADSLRSPSPPDQREAPPRHSWRLAGPRATDTADSTAAVYWKK